VHRCTGPGTSEGARRRGLVLSHSVCIRTEGASRQTHLYGTLAVGTNNTSSQLVPLLRVRVSGVCMVSVFTRQRRVFNPFLRWILPRCARCSARAAWEWALLTVKRRAREKLTRKLMQLGAEVLRTERRGDGRSCKVSRFVRKRYRRTSAL
jgi:hypothetical protein